MPYFFVDGFHAGRTSNPLYIHVENEESALARARQLGMEVTRIRGANEPQIWESRWTLIGEKLNFFTMLILPVITVFGNAFLDRESMVWRGLITIIVPISATIMMVYVMLQRRDKTIEDLLAEVKDLRSTVDRLKELVPSP